MLVALVALVHVALVLVRGQVLDEVDPLDAPLPGVGRYTLDL